MCKLGFTLHTRFVTYSYLQCFTMYNLLSMTLHNKSFLSVKVPFFRFCGFGSTTDFYIKYTEFSSIKYRGAEIKNRTCKSRFKLRYSNSLFFRQEGECWKDNNTVTIMRKASSITVWSYKHREINRISLSCDIQERIRWWLTGVRDARFVRDPEHWAVLYLR